MLWDCLIGWVIILFTLLGWSNGLVRNWTVPFSILVATYIAQRIYIDAATLLAETLHLEPTFSVFIAYLFSWLWLAQYCDHFLCHIVRMGAPSRDPAFISKVLGGLLGFTKGLGAFVLAAMVAYGQNKVPEPPQVCWENLWMIHAAADSQLLPKVHNIALKLDGPLGKYVLSDNAPRFHANFALGNDPFAGIEAKQERKGFEFVQSWKRFQSELGN